MRLVLLCLLTNFLTANAQAAQKVCFWFGGTDGQKGDRLLIETDGSALTVQMAVGSLDGLYTDVYSHESARDVRGRDGIVYLGYKIGSQDGTTTALVDESLAVNNSKGVLKIRWTGEAFSEAKYLCRAGKDL